ncbi:MAG: pseudaminic acid synthase [Bacteroidia bacterium]|nr:pseudaminic acid synthase [Bacteroidia bacterium]
MTRKTIKAMKEAGADAVKVQTLTPDTMTINCDNDYFKINSGTPWDGKTLYELYSETQLPWEWHAKIQEYADELGLIFFSTPYDKTAVDFLESIEVPAYKIASFEIMDIPLIEYVASKGKPVFVSTGMAGLSDIDEAVRTCRRMSNNQIVLLKCTSAYPAPFDEANLRTIPNMAEVFKTVVGLSDHTMGISVPIAAVVLGAKVIEKHFILDRNLGGPDAQFSMEPNEFKQMVQSIREVEQAIGGISYDLSSKIKSNRIFLRSLFVVEDIKKGKVFNESIIKSIRPGFGLHPKHLHQFIGKKARRDIKRGEPLSWGMLE